MNTIRIILAALLISAGVLAGGVAVLVAWDRLPDPEHQTSPSPTPTPGPLAPPAIADAGERSALAGALEAFGEVTLADGQAPSPRMYWSIDVLRLFDAALATRPAIGPDRPWSDDARALIADARSRLVAGAGIDPASDSQRLDASMRVAVEAACRGAAEGLRQGAAVNDKPLYPGGWAWWREADEIARCGLSVLAGDAEPADPGARNDRPFLAVFDQLRMNSCQGNALAGAVMKLIGNQFGRTPLLSRMFAYVRTQIRDGGRLSDSGSSISGGVWVAQNVGLPLEKFMPYGRYTRSVPAAAEQAAADLKAEHAVKIESAAAARSWLAQPDTVIHLGVQWRGSLSGAGEVVEDYGRGGIGDGLHAVLLLSNRSRRDTAGRPYTDLRNSHSGRWGDRGTTQLSPRCLDQIFETDWTHRLGAFGLRGVKVTKRSLVEYD